MARISQDIFLDDGDLPFDPIQWEDTRGHPHARVFIAERAELFGTPRSLQAWFAQGLRLADELVRQQDEHDDLELGRAQEILDRERLCHRDLDDDHLSCHLPDGHDGACDSYPEQGDAA